MPTEQAIGDWKDTIHTRYLNYLKTSFYFKDTGLRESFAQALAAYELMKGPFPESAHDFKTGINAHALAKESFEMCDDILPALRDISLYDHQEQAIRKVHNEQQNIVVATGTASGKTEGFLYPILFDLYQQHLDGKLSEPGVRALILYPMNALANDQRRRLGEIFGALENSNSSFRPTFGQYIGATPESKNDTWRNAKTHMENRLPGELIFREEMRKTPPHILLTNYSMLEYLLIRPEDSELFDNGRGRYWQFIVLDEAHQYRGTKGMEMGMLVRRLKQRLRTGGRKYPFRCIATSATISSGEGEEDKQAVGAFAETLFGERFTADAIIFGKKTPMPDSKPQRFHLFIRALEGAFLSYKNGQDSIILNRGETDDNLDIVALEIALCRECGQHYYAGREYSGYLKEATRDPSHADFGVDFYLPIENDADIQDIHYLCRQCGKLSKEKSACECDASILVKKCAPHTDHPEQLKECETCGYARGSIGDPVQEIVHGSDGPNSVIATALHSLLSKEERKLLAFADSRQEAAFFAWYVEHSYEEVRDRNFILRALKQNAITDEGLSIEDLQTRLQKVREDAGLFSEKDTGETRKRETLKMIYREAVTAERRIALAGVGLAKWFVKIPLKLQLPQGMFRSPWNFTPDEGRELLSFLLDRLRYQRAIALPEDAPGWMEVSQWPHMAVRDSKGVAKTKIISWGSVGTGIIKHFLFRLLSEGALTDKEKQQTGESLMNELWDSIHDYDHEVAESSKLLARAPIDGTFRLNTAWLRIKPPSQNEGFECNICASLSFYNIRGVCPRNGCPGNLAIAERDNLTQNHYRVLYEDGNMPAQLRAEEHTAQLSSDEAQKRQDKFINGNIDLLSSSTTFEVGVDLGDLQVVFLRNVPPEPFNYTQRVGRAGRRGDKPGLALTYCRRNSHDLYHYTDPETRILKGQIHPPKLQLTNEKIIFRHITAVALSAFFRNPDHRDRFKNVQHLFGDEWKNPDAVSNFQDFCRNNTNLASSLRTVVPADTHEKVGLNNDNWINEIAGENSRFADAENEICSDYRLMKKLEDEASKAGEHQNAKKFQMRANTIAGEKSLNFLSRKAIIPKYGFPVDVVDLDIRTGERKVSLQRDLSQAIAEYAPESKVVANKKEWKSYGVKIIQGKELAVKHYHYDRARDFKQWNRGETPPADLQNFGHKKYLSPQFGFVTGLFENPKEPRGRTGRLYTTRPFFGGLVQAQPAKENPFGVKITPALPGRMVVLCEGKRNSGFYICRGCGAGFAERRDTSHKTPENKPCTNTLEKFALGHEFVTDVVRMQFPGLVDTGDAYSLAYTVLLGAAETLNVPDTDLNATITASEMGNQTTIVLYDNVPGGAGLVASLTDHKVFQSVLEEAKKRVNGDCGCTESCYGCIRSYRNQFVHPDLQRKSALRFLESALESATC